MFDKARVLTLRPLKNQAIFTILKKMMESFEQP